jgi:MULE transposase domain
MEYERMFSEKGQPLIIFEKFKFRKYRVLKSTGEEVWCCTVKSCNSKLYVLDSIISSKIINHNHVLDEAVLMRQKVNNSIKRKAANLPDERPQKLIRRELEIQNGAIGSISSNDIRYIRNNMNYARLKLLPKLPKNTNEVQVVLNKIELKTSKGEPFLLINDMESNIVIFSCASNIDILCGSEVIFLDGTFNYCTKFFLQLFTIHAYVNNIYIPVVFCLLRNKLKNTYLSVFRLLRNKCSELGHHLNPKTVVIDFELAIHQSVQEIYLEANIV